MTKHRLKLATRKWERQFNQAVAQSIAKTLTEPLTNSYDSYKRMFGPADATTGLVHRILGLGVGAHVVHEDLLKDLPNRPRRKIVARVSTVAKATKLEKRECQVIDEAEGMSAGEMETKFEKYGAEKSGVGEGQAVRGLFGQGICDVVYSHQPGVIRSIKDDQAAMCDFTWEGTAGDREPAYEVTPLGKATTRLRKEWGLHANGTNVSCVLQDACRIPKSPENLVARLSGFYMLRLINADPHCEILLQQSRAEGDIENRLTYNFPRGQVVGKFGASIPYKAYSPLEVEVVVIRADTSLPTKDAGDERANGLLIVDEVDTVFDQTLFGFEGSPYLDQVYGVVRISGAREVLRAELNKNIAILTESRDGFDPKTEFYKALESALIPKLEPILKKEIERRSEPSKSLSEAAEKKVKRALQKLNQLFEDVTKKKIEGGPGGPGTEVPKTIEFEDERVQLRLGFPRRVRLLANAAVIRAGSAVIVDSDSPDVKIEPTSTVLEPSAANEALLTATFTLTGAKLETKSRITALSQDQEGQDLEAVLEIVDVVAPEIAEPPSAGLEFRPRESHSGPGRLGSLSLLIHPMLVPYGTSILVRKAHGDPSIKLVDLSGTERTELTLKFKNEHMLPGGAVGRIGISYRGYGFGQKAHIVADCFPRPGSNIRAEAWVTIQETKPPYGGVFRDVQYKDLPGGFAKNAGEFDPTTGMITINRLHPVNRASFGVDEKSFREAIDADKQSQFRLAEVVVDTCLFHMMAVAYQNSEIILSNSDVVTDVRKSLEGFKAQVEEDVFRHFVDGFRVPKLDGTSQRTSGDFRP